MDKLAKKACKAEYEKLDKDKYDYESFKAGFEACMSSLPQDETINKFMAISNIYAMTHPDGWSIKELQTYIRDNWSKLKKS